MIYVQKDLSLIELADLPQLASNGKFYHDLYQEVGEQLVWNLAAEQYLLQHAPDLVP